MACGRKSFPRILAATCASMICMLVFAPAAAARVTVVPGSVQGGGTETFAVRLSNEQPDLVTTRLELTFPPDVVIPRVEVARVGKWRAKVDMRRVDPPVTIDGEEVEESVASIVWTGGEVAPKQFEQFLVTAGPLPADGGRISAGGAISSLSNGPGAVVAAATGWVGRSRVNVDPCPGVEVTVRVPPSICASSRLMDSPSPVPP